MYQFIFTYFHVVLFVFADMSSGSELCQRGGDEAFPRSRGRADGEKTEENWYQFTAADDLPSNLPTDLTH